MTKQVTAPRARTMDEISAIAGRLRRHLGVDDVCAINLVRLTEFGLSRLIPDFTFSVVEDDALESSVLALSRDNPPEIVVRESIYRRAAKQEPMARWVLAHEIGHIVLQHAKPEDSGRHSNQFDVARAECQANVFAKFLLLPSDLVAPCASPSEISAKFLVSHSVAEARFKELRQKRKRTAFEVGRRPDAKAAGNESEIAPECCSYGFVGNSADMKPNSFARMTGSSNHRRGSMTKQPGLDGRHRDADGQIRHKNGNTRVDTLRETCGEDFAKGYRGDMKLENLLDRERVNSLSEYLKK